MIPKAAPVVYSYSEVPTLRDFARSDAFMRGVVGPFGCLSGDTEFLGIGGWKAIRDYEDGDGVFVWERDIEVVGRGWFEEPSGYTVLPCSEFIWFRNEHSLSMVLSGEHRVPYFDYRGEFRVEGADWVAGHPSRRLVPVGFRSMFCAEDIYVDGEGVRGMGPDFFEGSRGNLLLRLAVAVNADGHFPREGRRGRCIFGLRKRRKVDRLKMLLNELGISFIEKSYKSRPVERVICFDSPYIGKRFGWEWWGLSYEKFDIIFDELQHWDGSYSSEDDRFFTTSRGDADFIQFAAHATDRRASIAVDDYSERGWSNIYRVHITKKGSLKSRVYIREGTEISRVPSFDGKKYCFTVSTGFFLARHNGRIFVTGNSGKSSVCVMEVVRRGRAQAADCRDGIRRSRWAVVRNTYPQLLDTTIKTFHDWFPYPRYGVYNSTRHEYLITGIAGCEIEVWFRALDRPDQIQNLLSAEYTGAWVNEAREVPWEIIEALMGRVNRYPARKWCGPTWAGIWMDTNPPDDDSDWYRFFEEGEHPPGLVEVFHQTSARGEEGENLSNLPPDYYKNMMLGKDEDWVKVYVDGEYGFVREGRSVYPLYSDARHCREVDIDRGRWLLLGWDFGLTPAVVVAQIGRTGQLRVIDELCVEDHAQMGIRRFAETAVLPHLEERYFEWLEGGMILSFGDPAGSSKEQSNEDVCFVTLNSVFDFVTVPAYTNNFLPRKEAVDFFLGLDIDGEPGLVLSPRCKTLRKGFRGKYCYDRIQVGGVSRKFRDKPRKDKYSHPHDGLQYLAMMVRADEVGDMAVEGNTMLGGLSIENLFWNRGGGNNGR